MKSRWPAISGASVKTRIGASAFRALNSSVVAERMQRGWAPSRSGLIKGPSRCTPRIRAWPGCRSLMARATSFSALFRSSRGAVMVVASKLVVPCWA